ncbi:MAG TPA: NAD-glutamate dehydrogenase, partial [Coxiellaceae bacterium]|nr:NAD-glutamate dehydrogenase [Coxiellaceae bacterium]
MVPTDHSSINSLINKVIKYSDSCSIEKKQRKQFTSFVRLYFSHASLNDLKHRPVAELFGMVHSHWLLVCKPQQSGKRVLHVFNPTVEKDGWHSTHTVIELVTKDMPFVVDSMRMAMNRLDITVHLMVYTGGIQVSRDAAGNVTKIDMYEHDQKNTASVESPVYMEIDRQTDPVVLSNLKTQLQMALDDVRHAVEDWHKIRERVVASIDVLRFSKAPLLAKEVAESIAFLQWLLD